MASDSALTQVSKGASRRGRRTPSRRRDQRHSESGAVLILALAYIISVSMVVLALADWATSDLHNTSAFNSATETHLAYSGAMDSAIQSIRYTPDPSTTPPTNTPTPSTPGTCWVPTTGTVSQLALDGYTVNVYCQTTEDLPLGKYTRTVTLYACSSTVTETQCLASPELTAVVGIDDYPGGGRITLTSQCTPPECGYGETLISWTWI
jgi:hypothetical protein